MRAHANGLLAVFRPPVLVDDLNLRTDVPPFLT